MKNDGIAVRLGDLLFALNKRKRTIILLTLLGLIIGLLASGIGFLRGNGGTKHEIRGAIALNSRVKDGKFASSSQYPTNNDYHLAEDMVDAAIYILTSEGTVQSILDEYWLEGVEAEDVIDNLGFYQYESTLIIEERLNWNDPDQGVEILSAINWAATGILQNTMNVGGVNVITEPAPTGKTSGIINVILCAFLALMGLIIGIGITVLDLMMRPTLINPEDITNKLTTDLIGCVPYNRSLPGLETDLLLYDGFLQNVDDAYNSIAHVLQQRDGASQCLFVTSPTREEGSTNSVARLGCALARMEKRVLLVDLNYKNPRLGSFFVSQVQYEHSLNAFVRGEISAKEAITGVNDSLSILPAVRESGSSLSIDRTTIELLNGIKDGYDYVIIDTPPILQNPDVLSLGELVDYSVVIVRCDHASVKDVNSAFDVIRKSGIPVKGCVVNCAKDSAAASFAASMKNPGEHTERPARPESVISVLGEEDGTKYDTSMASIDFTKSAVEDVEPEISLTAEAPVEEQEDVPAVEAPAEEPEDVPAVEASAEEPEDVPAAEAPAEEPEDVPAVEAPVEAPAEEPEDVPVIEEPVEEPEDVPVIEEPVEEPEVVPAAEVPAEEPEMMFLEEEPVSAPVAEERNAASIEETFETAPLQEEAGSAKSESDFMSFGMDDLMAESNKADESEESGFDPYWNFFED